MNYKMNYTKGVHYDDFDDIINDNDIKDSLGTLPDNGLRKQSFTGALKEDARKGNPHLIPTSALKMLAQRFQDGADKYGARNWEKGHPLSNYIDSLYRHLWQFMDGETDEDHLAAVLWNAVALADTYTKINNGDLPQTLNDL